MRLEGVRRGSTTVGYFDLVGDNAITRTISSQAFRRDHGSPQALAYGQVHGVIDLPRTLDDVQEAIMPYLVELLLSYVDEVFSYISVAFCNQVEKMEPLDNPNSRSSSVHSEIKEQTRTLLVELLWNSVFISRGLTSFLMKFSPSLWRYNREVSLHL